MTPAASSPVRTNQGSDYFLSQAQARNIQITDEDVQEGYDASIARQPPRRRSRNPAYVNPARAGPEPSAEGLSDEKSLPTTQGSERYLGQTWLSWSLRPLPLFLLVALVCVVGLAVGLSVGLSRSAPRQSQATTQNSFSQRFPSRPPSPASTSSGFSYIVVYSNGTYLTGPTQYRSTAGTESVHWLPWATGAAAASSSALRTVTVGQPTATEVTYSVVSTVAGVHTVVSAIHSTAFAAVATAT